MTTGSPDQIGRKSSGNHEPEIHHPIAKVDSMEPFRPGFVRGQRHRFDRVELAHRARRGGAANRETGHVCLPSPPEPVFPIRFFLLHGKALVRTFLRDLSLVSEDNALFIGAPREVT